MKVELLNNILLYFYFWLHTWTMTEIWPFLLNFGGMLSIEKSRKATLF